MILWFNYLSANWKHVSGVLDNICRKYITRKVYYHDSKTMKKDFDELF